MKSTVLTLFSLVSFVSCSHHSFDPISYYDVTTFSSSCKIASEIREDISGVHKRAYEDSLTITENYINDDSGGWTYQETLYLELSKNYPRETVEIILKNIQDIYEDADCVMLQSGLMVLPLISVSAILETALSLSEKDERPL